MDLGLNKNHKKRSLTSEGNNNYERNSKKDNKYAPYGVYGYGDGISWFRGCLIGKGCFGSVFIATLKNPKSKHSSYPPIMAVKSAEVSVSSTVQKEREVLNNIRGCRNVIRCFGDEITNGDNGQMVYNLLLEYGSGGTLADLIKRFDRIGLPELDVKRHTRSIVRGLRHIHRCGYVHCDLKPQNILLVSNSGGDRFVAKIGDLGLAKRAKQTKKGKLVPYCRGTPMYFSPEVVMEGVQEAPSDIWAVGCIVFEMLTAKDPNGVKGDGDEVIARIREVNESALSSEAKSFLKGCFSRKSIYRWTAEMLLAHPFLEGMDDVDEEDDDNNVEDSGGVYDINAISSLVMSGNEDDETISFSSCSDGFYCWDDEDVGGTENELSSCYSVEEERSTTATLNEVHQYPVAFTISSGV